ncbi:MAG: agmatinase [Bacteroidota bacterium]
MIATLDIPFDEFSSFLRGPALGPAKIREAFHSDSANYFTESLVDLKDHPTIKELGPLKLPSGAGVTEAIEHAITDILAQYDKVFSLGGDHSVTYPIIKAFAKKYKDLTILHIDAHPDLYDVFEGNKFSHACPFARIMESGLATRLVQVGIRTMAKHQREQADKFGVEVIQMKDFNPLHKFEFDGPVYVSLDIDAIDPAFAPGVSHHEPGGLTSREVIRILQSLRPNLVGADLVEFNPTRDPSGITAMLAAKLYKELLDVLLRSDR